MSPLPPGVRSLRSRIAAGLRAVQPKNTNRSAGPLGIRAFGPSATALAGGRVPARAGPDDDQEIDPLDRDDPGRNIAWVPVRSIWIAALRWVPTGRRTPTAYLAEGYIDMRVYYQNRAYRYGPGISQRQFITWRVAASRGRYWWRYFTRRWSPARRIA